MNGSSNASAERRRAMTTPEATASGIRMPFVERRSGIAMTPDQVAARRAPSYFEGPTQTLALLAVLVLLGMLFAGIGFTRSTSRMAPLADAYRQTGSFSYSATPKSPTPVYPSGKVKTGDPIYPSLVNMVTVHFGYRFASSLTHHVKGTIELQALVLSQSDTWQDPVTIQAPTPFNGDSASITKSLPLSSLYDLLKSVSTQSGSAAASYTVDLQPLVHLNGVVGMQAIHATFAPVLPFTIGPTEITLNGASAPALPGATYVAASQSAEMASTVHPEQVGSINHLAPSVISVAKYAIKVSVLRFLGIFILIAAFVIALIHERLRRRQTMRSDEELIAHRLGSVIVPIVSLDDTEGPAPIAVPGFSHLAGLAKFLERPILYEIRNGTRSYAVDDGIRCYVFRAVSNTEASPSPTAPAEDQSGLQAPNARKAIRRHRIRGSRVAQGAVGILALGVASTFATTFTASSSVPASSVGKSTQARTISELTPAGCSSLGLTSLVEKSGSFTNSSSHVLILGSAGVDTIVDSGTGNCIVGGAGKDTVFGTSTDICIIGPTAGTTYSGCTKVA
jgi:hypothetical protein